MAMDSTESCVPPGFRFHPTDEELVGYYLRKKVASQKIDLDVIRDIDLYRIEPWDLQERCRIGYEEQSEWYFFSHKDKKYPTGTRTNRATMAGFWKATGRDKAVHERNRLIGMRKTLVFYRGRAPNGQKTDWIMHEYRLESDENAPPQEEGWVVCRAFKKRINPQPRPWGEEARVIDPFQYMETPPYGFLCKQETGIESLDLLHPSLFLHLPQLESPTIPLPKRTTDYDDEEQQQANECNPAGRVTDWQTLDKFVASQFSPIVPVPDVATATDGNPEMVALLLLEGTGEEEGAKLDDLLGSDSDCNVGICVYDGPRIKER